MYINYKLNNFLNIKMESKTLTAKYKAYKNGGQIPVMKAYTVINKMADLYTVVLSKETVDRDGEIINLTGIELPVNGVPFLDAHRQNGSAIEERLGTLKNIRIEGDELKGEIMFWEGNPKGLLAKELASDPDHPMPVSIGFGVKEYDPLTKTILEWELYELSLVNVPANVEAKLEKGITIKEYEDIFKKIKRYEQIRPAFKEFTKLFFNDSFVNRLGMEKTEDLVFDIAKMYTIIEKFITSEEDPKEEIKKEEVPQEIKLTKSDLLKLVENIQQVATQA